jgi:hypothetical protein
VRPDQVGKAVGEYILAKYVDVPVALFDDIRAAVAR